MWVEQKKNIYYISIASVVYLADRINVIGANGYVKPSYKTICIIEILVLGFAG